MRFELWIVAHDAFFITVRLRPLRPPSTGHQPACCCFSPAGPLRQIQYCRDSKNIYQTNGLCKDFCTKDYAYAITQEQLCWCSNYTPSKSDQVDMNQCNINCPAYPDEKCGGKGVFGYVQLNAHLPSGTRGSDSSSASSTSTSSVASSSSSTSSTTTTTTSSSSSSSSSTSITDASTLTTSTTQQTSMIHTVTTDTGGIIKTVTIMPTVTGDLEGGSQGSSGSSSKLAGGAIAGIVIGIVAALLFGVGLAFFLYRRRKQNESKADYQGDPSVRGSSSERMSSIRPEMSMTGASAASPTQNSNRNSTLQIDPRMDPFKQNLYARSGSHESINTLRDDHDYSRRIQQPKVLRATNPDPE
uniref:WSC domain-containing protein n=1 Tax=Bionectria ochroleuca TaxID=29856 RepID=A0A0B7JTU9_BIOOC